MLKKRLLPLFLCLALLMSLAACQKNDSYKLIECPLEGLEWGMAWDDVIEHLDLTKEEQDAAEQGTNLLRLTTARAGIPSDFCDIAFADDVESAGWRTVNLYFTQNENGIQVLSGSELTVGAEFETLTKALEKQYGAICEDAGSLPTWVSVDPETEWSNSPYLYLSEKEATPDNTYTLVFEATSYVEKLNNP